jgi:GNAT superfamily N-acetyltransferase
VTSFTVRQAGLEDFPIVLTFVGALLNELGEEGDETGTLSADHLYQLSQSVGDGHITFLAETLRGSPIGLLTLAECFAFYNNGHYGVINEMFVEPQYRSVRVGSALIDKAISHGLARGWRRIDVTAPESERWSRTRRFYESQGFAFTGPKLKLSLSPFSNSLGVGGTHP